ncbi:MAG: BMC domain-containing protein, partial [Acidimicrobiia bacterium]
HMADGLGGKGYSLFSGDLADVEAAVEIGVSHLPHPELLVARVVIPRLHPEMLANLVEHPEFGPRARSYKG